MENATKYNIQGEGNTLEVTLSPEQIYGFKAALTDIFPDVVFTVSTEAPTFTSGSQSEWNEELPYEPNTMGMKFIVHGPITSIQIPLGDYIDSHTRQSYTGSTKEYSCILTSKAVGTDMHNIDPVPGTYVLRVFDSTDFIQGVMLACDWMNVDWKEHLKLLYKGDDPIENI